MNTNKLQLTTVTPIIVAYKRNAEINGVFDLVQGASPHYPMSSTAIKV